MLYARWYRMPDAAAPVNSEGFDIAHLPAAAHVAIDDPVVLGEELARSEMTWDGFSQRRVGLPSRWRRPWWRWVRYTVSPGHWHQSYRGCIQLAFHSGGVQVPEAMSSHAKLVDGHQDLGRPVDGIEGGESTCCPSQRKMVSCWRQ